MLLNGSTSALPLAWKQLCSGLLVAGSALLLLALNPGEALAACSSSTQSLPGAFSITQTVDSTAQVGCSTTAAQPNSVSVTVTGPLTITVPQGAPAASDGVHAETNGANVGSPGNATATVSNVTINNQQSSGAAGVDSLGIQVVAGEVGVAGTGSALLTVSGNNTITTVDGGGTLSQARGLGDATTIITGTLVINNNSTGSDTQDGIETTVRSGTAILDMSGVDSAVINVSAGHGIFIDSLTQGALGGGDVVGTINSNVIVNLTNASGAANAGIRAVTTLAGTIDLITGATVNTFGTAASGIHATTANGDIDVTNSGTITTTGATSHGIEIATTGGAIESLDNSGTIVAQGAGSNGIQATTATGLIDITTSGDVTSWLATGVLATATGGAGTLVVSNEAAGSISGVTGIGIVGGFTSALIDNAGLLGAATDLAVDSTALTGPLDMVNSGTMTGYVELGGAVNTLANSGTWNLRNFSGAYDATGVVVRDTLGVAIADFGTAGANTITNTGTVALVGPGGDPVTTLDPTGQYLPFGFAFNSMAIGGPVQGQILGVATFDHSGVLDLTANGVPGDVLLISGGQVAGTPGGGAFVTNGGTLLLNTVLNEGGANSQSDILVLDSTTLGSAPTAIVVNNFGGAGALTVGNGIALVEVLDNLASAPGVFVLGAPVGAGAYDYDLFHNGVGADFADGNWYLRSTGFRIETDLDPVLPELLLDLGRNMLGTYRDRVGEEPFDPAPPAEPAEPIFCKDPSQNFLCVPTAEQQAVYADALPPEQRIFWARAFGEAGSVDFGGDPALGPSYGFTIGGVQAGADLFRQQNLDGTRDVAGLYAGVGSAGANVQALDGSDAGDASVTGLSLGAYWTRTGESGWYLDAVVQGTFNMLATRSSQGVDFNTTGWGFAGSLEAGYPIGLGDGWSIEPQAQMIFQIASIEDASDGMGLVSFDNVAAVDGRLGVRLAKDWTSAEDRTLTTWVHADIRHSFTPTGTTADPVATTTFAALDGSNPVTFSADTGGTWGSLGIGASGEINDTTRLFASADYKMRLDGHAGSSFGGRVGFRIKW